MKLAIARAAVAGATIVSVAVTHLLAQSAPTDSLVPLAIEYGGRSQLHLRAGETLTLRPSLRNVGMHPLTIAHPTRLFVLDAYFSPAHAEAGPSTPSQFPKADTWGEEKHLEFPNPSAVYTMPLITKTLKPGEVYAPALLYQRSEYRVRFDSAGTYAVRVCAHLTAAILCGSRDISVIVN
jgi:hypothetical protein